MIEHHDKLQLSDYQFKIELALEEIGGVISLQIIENEILVHMAGSPSSSEQGDIRDRINDLLNDLFSPNQLDSFKVNIVSKNDRLIAGDILRKNIEHKVKESLIKIIGNGNLSGNSIMSIRVRWGNLTKLLRWLGIGAEGKVIKITLSNTEEIEIEKLKCLIGDIEGTFNMPVLIRGLSIFESKKIAEDAINKEGLRPVSSSPPLRT